MELYLVSQDMLKDYDMYDAIVVAAETEERTPIRQLAATLSYGSLFGAEYEVVNSPDDYYAPVVVEFTDGSRVETNYKGEFDIA